MFESSRIYGLFTAYFNAELYNYAEVYYDTHVFNRFNYVTAVVGVTKVLEDVEISQHNRPLYQDMKHFLEQDFAVIYKVTQVPDNFEPYISARLDIKLMAKGDFQIVSVSDDKAVVFKPEWLQKDGVDYIIRSYAGKLGFVAKTNVDGRINLNLRGMWVQNPEKTKLIPYWIDYTKFVVNGKLIFDKLTPTWFNKPYYYAMEIKAGEEVKIQLEWLPHRSDT